MQLRSTMRDCLGIIFAWSVIAIGYIPAAADELQPSRPTSDRIVA